MTKHDGEGVFGIPDDAADLAEEFLSVDVDSQLKKLPSRAFRSAHHYVVELVRGALQRGASEVKVNVSLLSVTVSDNGDRIDPALLRDLINVVDRSSPASVREEALARFEQGTGLTLLAVLAPNPSMVEIETGDEAGQGERVVLPRNRTPLLLEGTGRSGTLIRIRRKPGSASGERRAVLEYCRFAKGTIWLNGSRLLGRPDGALAMANVAPVAGHGGGLVWIPQHGDICRVWLLKNSIRWRQALFPPSHGIVYHAALECEGVPPAGTLKVLRNEARKLLELLARQYHALPPNQAKRVEELLFTHYRWEGRSEMVEKFAPFRLAGSGRRLSLAEIREESERDRLRALKVGSRIRKFDIERFPVLLLTSEQWDFLVRHALVKLKEPPRKPRAVGMTTLSLVEAFRAAVNAVAAWMSRKPIAARDLSPHEQALIDILDKEVESNQSLFPRSRGGKPVVMMVDSRCGRPATVLRGETGPILAVTRHHKIVEIAVRALARDPMNREMVLAALLQGGTLM